MKPRFKPDPLKVFPALAAPQPGCEIADEIDDMGNVFEACPKDDNGHLFFHGWCLHCGCEEAE